MISYNSVQRFKQHPTFYAQHEQNSAQVKINKIVLFRHITIYMHFNVAN